MKIRTSLRITSTISILMMLGSTVGSFFAFKWLRQASAFELQLIDLQGDVFEGTLLRDEYLLMARPQSLVRWKQKSLEIAGHLKDLSGRSLSPSSALLLDRMNQKFQATWALLPRIAALRSSNEGGESGKGSTWRIEQRLTNQLLVDTYLLSDSTKLLLLEARRDSIDERNNLLLLLALSTLALGLTVTSASTHLNHLLSRRVAVLKTWTYSISNGKLDYRIPLGGDDELADLAREVNDLAEKLQRTYESLEATNRELEAFSYSVSHDLRAPLRHLTGFVELLWRMDLSSLDVKSQHYLTVISDSAKKMGCLIDDLLSFSRMGRGEMMKRNVNMGQLVHEVIAEHAKDLPPGRFIDWRIGTLPTVVGDQAMLRLVLTNLVSNAVKYSRQVAAPIIEISASTDETHHVLCVRDNGAGFDMRFVDKLFVLFQRLHSSEEYEGTGVGLASVRRIITRHGGRTWAEGEPNIGATFYFTLPQGPEG